MHLRVPFFKIVLGEIPRRVASPGEFVAPYFVTYGAITPDLMAGLPPHFNHRYI
jgi:hypothetical protein